MTFQIQKKFKSLSTKGMAIVTSLLLAFILPDLAKAQAVPAHSVDAILVYEELVDNNVRYLFRGHTPAIPNNDAGNPGPITGWNWFSGNPAAPTLNTPATIGQGGASGAPYPAMPKVAFSREGYAIVVYTRFTKTGQINCGTAEDPSLIDKWKGDLRWARYRDGVAGIVDQGTIVTAAENEYHVAPSVAIDNNGQGLAVWYHIIDTGPCTFNTTSGVHFSRWNGNTSTWTAHTHIDGTANHTGVPLGGGVFSAQLIPLSTAINFNSVVVDPVTAPITRQQAVAVWYDFIDLQSETCPGDPEPIVVTLPTLWPRHSVWDGDSWSAPALIPDPPNKWKSQSIRGKLDISPDQKGNSVPVWPVRKVTNVCTGAATEEVWSARHRGSDNTWPKTAAKYDNGTDTSIAFDTGNDNFVGPDDQRATSYFAGTPHEPFFVKRDFYTTKDDLWSLGLNFQVSSRHLTNAYLPHFRRLLVFQSFPGAIITWYDEDRVANTTTNGNIEAGIHPDLAARGGGTTIPHQRWSVPSYGAGDAGDQDPQMLVLRNRVQEVGSTNLISWVYHRDRPADNSRSHYVKRGSVTEVRDWGANLDFSVGNTLRDVIAWHKEFYPADKYILDTEDHGQGWRGLCVDGANWIEMPELKNGIHHGLQDALDKPFFGQPIKLSHLIFMPCQMSMVEVAYQIRNQAEFMVASGENTPNAANQAGRLIRYQNILQQMIDSPFISDLNLSNFMVDDYQAANAGANVSDYNYASMRISNVPALRNDLNALAQQITNYINPGTAGEAGRRGTIRTHVTNTIQMRGETTYRDLFDFSQRLGNDVALPLVLRNASNAVSGHEANVVTRVWSDVNRAGWNGLNIWIEMTKAILQTGGGANTALSNQYLATDFGTDAPNWHAMLINISQTPGVLLRLTADNPLLLLGVADAGGGQVSVQLNSNENCGPSCTAGIAGASCYPSVSGPSQIFIPQANGSYTWTINGSTLNAAANFTLTIQELADDLSVVQEQIVNGVVNPGGSQQGIFATGPGPDTLPPVTTAALAGTPGQAGWWRSAVTVTLSAVDNASGSGVQKTEYNVDAGPWVTYTAPFSITPDGAHVLEYRSIDNNNNVETTKQETVSIDKTVPSVVCPANPVNECSSPAGQSVNLGVPTTADAVSGIASVINNAPAQFTLGTTAVTWTATDVAGNEASCQETVTVVDTTPPTITCVANIQFTEGQPVTLSNPAVNDTCDAALTPTNNAPAQFPLGTTQVTWTVADDSGNTAQCITNVTINPQPVACGMTVNQNLILAQDLACPETALNIGAGGITVDCQGHTIAGQGTNFGININQKSNITIQNCVIKNFASGVAVQGASGCSNISITGSTFKNNGAYGVDAVCLTAQNIQITGNTFDTNGVSAFNSGGGVEIVGNGHTISGNTYTGGKVYGIVLLASNSTVSGNTFTGNLPVQNPSPWTAIRVWNSNANTISNNTVQKHDVGIKLTNATGNSIFGNTITDNAVNVNVDPSSNNTITGNLIGGGETGITIVDSQTTTVHTNQVINNINGIVLTGSTGNHIYNNYFNNQFNASDSGANTWNIAKTAGVNIIQGSFLGGNFWHDYIGQDTDGDGLGDTLLPYTSGGNILSGGDSLPLVLPVADADGDGVPDNTDNCPAIFNSTQSDADGDGIGDACDNCTNLANPDQLDTNTNGIGDACEIKFRRGDSNGDGKVDISDPINTLGFLFLGTGTINCQDAGDANDDGQVDISDAIRILGWLFTGDAAPPAPGPLTPGVDPTNDALTCNQYPTPQGGGAGGGGSVKEAAAAIDKSTQGQQTKDNLKNVLNIVPKGKLSVSSYPIGAYFYLDGKYKGYTGLTPITIKDLYEGSYQVKFTKYSYETYQSTVKILPGQTTTIKPKLKPLLSPSPSPTPSPTFTNTNTNLTY